MYININGKFYKKNKAKISVLDRGFLYGDGIFETMRVYREKIFALSEHLDRLKKSAGMISLKLSMSKKELERELYRTLRKNELKEAIIRLSFSRGVGPFGIGISNCRKPTLVIIARKFRPYPDRFYKNGVSVIVSKKVVSYSGSFLSGIKSSNYLSNILARSEISKKNPAFEALLLNEKGHVTEGTVSNFFLVRNGRLITPPLKAGILPGVTRKIVLKLARELKIKTESKFFKKGLIYRSEECFLTNTSIEVLPVTKISGKIIASGKPGKMTLILREKFKKLVTQMITDNKSKGHSAKCMV